MVLKEMLARVEERRKAKNLSKRQVGILAGRSGDLIRNWERRAESGKPVERGADNEAIDAVAKVLGVTGDWLREGGDLDGDSLKLTQSTDNITYVPLFEIDAIECRGDRLHVPNELKAFGFPSDFLRRLTNSPYQELCVVAVRGEAMVPVLMDGDVVLLDRSRNSTDRDGLFAVGYGSAVKIRKLDRAPNGFQVSVLAANPAYASYEVDTDALHVVGQAVWIGRRV
ncbi:S24 family peptidase [Histidinibacterium lentulum]|uniref:S24 family peptidase n=1 Tax=Histidinibacterium lentulum TaxID=2480588 RepID=UPI000F4B833E|nr:S24 family peptidase [Histidinibacterium lentulum]